MSPRPLLLLLPLVLAASTLRAQTPSVEELATALEGSRSSARQSSADPAGHPHIRYHARQIWGGRSDGPWLYVEQAVSATQNEPSHQSIQRLAKGSRGVVIAEMHAIPDAWRYAGAWFDTMRVEDLAPESLERQSGCDVTWRKKGSAWSGTTPVRGCRSMRPEVEYTTTELTLEGGTLALLERGFNANGAQTWGPKKDGYRLERLDAKSPGAIGRDLSAALGYARALELDTAIALYEHVVAIDPDNADARALLAAALRYSSERLGDAVASARSALAIAPCHPYAQSVLGDLFNPQHSMYVEANVDSTWEHYLAAVGCDPNGGDAWMGIWTEALRRGDDEMRRRSLESLRRSGYITPLALELAHWYLRDLPANAIFVVDGDIDTYSMAIVQELDGYRRDVAVVNASLLDLPWYARQMRDERGLEIAIDDEMLDEAPEADGMGESETQEMTARPRLRAVPPHQIRSPPLPTNRQIIDHWIGMVRRRALARPLVFALSYRTDDEAPPLSGFGRYAGTHMLPSDVEYVDTAALRRRLTGIDGARFRGRQISLRDMSLVRRTYDDGAGQIARVALALGYEHLANGQYAGARDAVAWLRRFVDDAKLSGNDEYIDDLEASIDEQSR